MIIVVLGPPGAGKGIQSRAIANACSIPSIGFSDLLRTEIRKGTDIGAKAAVIMEQGEHTPIDIAIPLLKRRLQQGDTHAGFVLEGFPRNIDQARALGTLLEELKLRIDHVIYLDVSRSEMTRRLSDRVICSDEECGHVQSMAVASFVERCEKCGGELRRRDDDRPATVSRRWDLDSASSYWIDQFYEPLLQKFDGDDESQKLTEAILALIKMQRQ